MENLRTSQEPAREQGTTERKTLESHIASHVAKPLGIATVQSFCVPHRVAVAPKRPQSQEIIGPAPPNT